MIFYDCNTAPSPRRVRMFIQEKKINIETKNVDLRNSEQMEDWFSKINPKSNGEDDMLDQAYEPKKNSRLSCQISVTDELDGLIVNLPKKQI